ncbi:sec24-like protein [Polyporus arcularius HHB13444]|uniref:Sec24-like protein n=1 Tax=Polyporus arcularius HHB13444 TaxID=1314778 RepID=A0A5C3P6S0_9APHY|nr:sec24-like protein [Polyporus arcularius HHB13444]
MYAHGPSSHIPQPPHSAGTPYKGLRAAIDPNQIPSPIDTIELDREKWEEEPYPTLPGHHAPLSTTDYVAIDQGNSSPRYVRMSTWNMPSSSRLASECEVPIAAVIQPFADQDPREEPVPLVDTGDVGPARCARCRAYINPWCAWVSNGARWRCNLCSHETDVAPEYYCALDASLLRLDHLQRPELNKGTVDFAVPEQYWAPHPPPAIRPLYYSMSPDPSTSTRKPRPMDYVFAFDVSQDAVRLGFLQTACNVLLELLYGRDDSVLPCFPTSSRIAILAFDRTLQFYNLSSEIVGQPPMLVVPDVDDVFLPSTAGLFVNHAESRDAIIDLLTALPTRHEQTVENEVALGSALSASLAALAGRGGQVVVFASSIPTIGVGALEPLVDESTLYGTDKERTLFEPREETWKDIGEQCAAEGVGVSMFLGPARPIDVASIGVPASLSGGELYFFPRFDPIKDAPCFASHFRRLISRTTVYSCSMRVRCSVGLRVSKQYGNFYESAAGDMEFGTLDADKTLAIALEHVRTLDDRQYAFIQSALLYTTREGQRRVRVHNVALRVVTLAGNVFQFADMDAVVSLLLREAISKLPSYRFAQIHESLTEKCALILYAYRKFCAAAAAPTQLILPEAFRTLPVYVLAMMKTKPLKGRSVTADVRNYYGHKISAMSARRIMHHLYPRMLALHDLNDEIALPDANGRVDLPSLMRCSHLFMESHGVYLIDNEDAMMLWIGASVSPQLLKDLLGVDDIWEVDQHMLSLPQLPTRLSTQVRNILAHRNAQRGYTPKFTVARQNIDGAEIEFSDMLVEDQNNAAMSYIDYLCLVHKQIHTALTTGASIASNNGFRSMPW